MLSASEISITFAPLVQSESVLVSEEGRASLRAIGGKPSWEALDIAEVNTAFVGMLGQDFAAFQERMTAGSSGIMVEGDYVVGSACAPHQCGFASAAYALSLSTGALYVVVQHDQKSLKVFGPSSRDDLPPYLRKFIAEIESTPS